jgi:threonine dehydrogenase-like Zn-dependent dehydrogenase
VHGIWYSTITIVHAAHTCVSELHSLYQPSSSVRQHQPTWGYIAGHEPAGVVEQIGADVRGLRVGERVFVYHIQGCGHCKYCLSGWMLHCPVAKRSYGWDINGGHADFILVDARNCVLLPDELSFVEGACCACGVGTAYQATKRIGVSGRDTVAIVGLGPVGLGGVMLAKAMGARVVGIDLVPERLELAKQLGADEVLDGSKLSSVEAIRDLTHGEGADVAIDYSGSAEGRNSALDAVRIWGRVAFVGEGNRTTITPSPQMLHKQLTVYGSWVFGLWEAQELARFLVDRQVSVERMVTHRFPLERVGEAINVFESGRTGKVVLVTP